MRKLFNEYEYEQETQAEEGSEDKLREYLINMKKI